MLGVISDQAMCISVRVPSLPVPESDWSISCYKNVQPSTPCHLSILLPPCKQMCTQAALLTCSMKEVFIGIGIELGYLIGLPCVTVLGGWRIVFGMALLFALIMKTGMVSFPC